MTAGKYPKTKEHRENLSRSLKGRPNLKKRGVPLSEEHKEKIRQSRIGDKHWNWQGGVSKMKGYGAIQEGRRRARKKGNGGSHTFGDWELLKAQYDWTCPCCKKSEPEISLTQDHIIPISRGGTDNIENIQPLCLDCNQHKHTNSNVYSR